MSQDKLFGSLHMLLCFYNNKVENLGASMFNPITVVFIFIFTYTSNFVILLHFTSCFCCVDLNHSFGLIPSVIIQGKLVDSLLIQSVNAYLLLTVCQVFF